jgi:Cys-rich four helix bundle protein (predicted Tat secretion target)
MDRRQFLIGVGAAAALASTPAVYAENNPSPMGAEMHGPMYAVLQKSTAHCVTTGEDCLRHCFGMLSMNDTSMAGCIKTSYDMVTACTALQSLADVNSSHVPALARAVAAICLDCQKQCEKFSDVTECKACAESCAVTIKECQRLAI